MKCYTPPLSSLIATFDHISYFIQFFLLTHIINKLFVSFQPKLCNQLYSLEARVISILSKLIEYCLPFAIATSDDATGNKIGFCWSLPLRKKGPCFTRVSSME
jgi:hypothetical protein